MSSPKPQKDILLNTFGCLPSCYLKCTSLKYLNLRKIKVFSKLSLKETLIFLRIFIGFLLKTTVILYENKLGNCILQSLGDLQCTLVH